MRRTERDMTSNAHTSVCICSARYSCQISMKLEFSQKILGKNIQMPDLMKIRPVGAEVCPCEWTERYDEAIDRFSQFC